MYDIRVTVRHPTHRTIQPPRTAGANPSLLSAVVVGYDICSVSTTLDADPTNCQYRNGQQSQQTQGTSSAAPHLKDPARLLTPLLQLSFNLVKSVLQDFTRLDPISRFGSRHEL